VEWISVKDRLPPRDIEILATDGIDIHIGRMNWREIGCRTVITVVESEKMPLTGCHFQAYQQNPPNKIPCIALYRGKKGE